MGSPAIFSGKFTKLLTQKGIINSDGSLNQFDGYKNYITYNNFENGLTTGWSLFNTTLTSGLPTGTITAGAASLDLFDASNSNPLSGSYSMRVGSSATANWAAGQGVISDEFTIEREDLAKSLTYSFSYIVSTGATNANWSGVLGQQSIGVFLYDVTEGAWVAPSGYLGLNQTSGSGTLSGEFQTSNTAGQKYRLAILCLQVTTGPMSLKLDSFKLGQDKPTIGTPITDFITYTPTISWTSGVSSTDGYYRRIGDSIECVMQINISGGVSAVDLTVDIPSGLTMDTAKMAGAVQGNTPVYGEAIGFDTSTSNRYVMRTQFWDTNSIRVIYQSSSTGQVTAVTSALPVTWASGDTISIRFVVPVSGFTSEVEMSSSSSSRVVGASFRKDGTTQSIATATVTKVTYQTTDFDTLNGWDSANNRYYTRLPGLYYVSAIQQYTSAVTDNRIYLYKNGVFYRYLDLRGSITTATGSGSGLVECSANDYLEIYTIQGSGSTVTLNGSSTSNCFQVFRLSGPSAIAASETVAAEYVSTAGNTLTNATGLFIDFPTKQADTHTAVLGAGSGNNATATSTWRYVAPISGRYIVNASITFASAASTNVEFISRIYVNGAVVQQGIRQSYAAWVTSDLTIPATAELRLNAGDYVSIYVYQSSGANRAQATGTGSNRVSIIRVGNI